MLAVCLDGSQKKLDGKGLEAFALFKKGVQPRWEDEQNINGGHWEWRRTEVDPEVLDKMWTNVVLGESYGWDVPFWHQRNHGIHVAPAKLGPDG